MVEQWTVRIPTLVESSTVAVLPKVHALPFAGELPAALLTGFPIVDDGHRHLLFSISSLRRICIDQVAMKNCATCSEAMRQGCEGNLIGMLGDLISFILEHFRAEEEIMRDSLLLMVDREHCEAHMEDHAEISGKVQEIVAALDRMNTVSRIRELDGLLSRWLTHHIALHDVLLVGWIGREDSIHKLVKR